MRKTIIVILLLTSIAGTILGEENKPQIAYRILDEYIAKKELGARDKTGGYITMGVGAALIGGSIGMYLLGDDITAAMSETGEPWSTTTKNITAISLAGGGLLTATIGALIVFSPVKDYRAEYNDIFSERDPLVQEALAAAALYDMAEKGKRDRITGGVTDLAYPLLTIAVTMIINNIEEKPWHEGMMPILSGLSWNLISGVSKLFFEKTREERNYEKYLIAKEALLVSGKTRWALAE